MTTLTSGLRFPEALHDIDDDGAKKNFKKKNLEDVLIGGRLVPQWCVAVSQLRPELNTLGYWFVTQ